jgi:hypothetical protein
VGTHERFISDDPPQPLLDRDPTPEDTEAEHDEPRPGVWAGEDGADLRRLTQDETDALIRAELWQTAMPLEDLTAAVGSPSGLRLQTPRASALGGIRMSVATTQRGGIDSDPLVRVLARRAWGDRDRQWFELRGVRRGEAVRTVPIPGPPRSGSSVVLAWPGERSFGVAQYDAAPGERVHVSDSTGVGSFDVGDRLREPPVAPGWPVVDLDLDAELEAQARATAHDALSFASQIGDQVLGAMDRFMLDAIAAGIPVDDTWQEFDVASGERRLMTQPGGLDRSGTSLTGRMLARVWVERDGMAVRVRTEVHPPLGAPPAAEHPGSGGEAR